MSAYHSRSTNPSIYRDHFGCTPREFETLVAVLAHERTSGIGVTRDELAAFNGHQTRVTTLKRAGLIVADESRPERVVVTAKALKRLGVERFEEGTKANGE